MYFLLFLITIINACQPCTYNNVNYSCGSQIFMSLGNLEECCDGSRSVDYLRQGSERYHRNTRSQGRQRAEKESGQAGYFQWGEDRNPFRVDGKAESDPAVARNSS